MYPRICATTTQIGTLLAGLLLFCSLFAQAQIQIGDNVQMNMNGDLGYGYSGTNGNFSQASHSNGFVGNGDINGFYFHPNFLSFNVRPYYQRNQSNDDSQSISTGSGIAANVGFFGGSRFPGAISYGLDFSKNSEFMVAGVPTLNANSSGQSFGISWSALIPKLPTLTATYTTGSNESQIEGFLSPSNTSSRSFNLTSGYTIAGFRTTANYNHYGNDFTTPEILTGTSVTAETTGNSLSVATQHALPLRGSIGLGWGHGNSSSDTGANWTTNTYTATNTFMPWRKISLFQNVTYTDDTVAAYAQSVLNGAASSSLLNDAKTSGANYSAGASYDFGYGLTVSGHYTRRWLWAAGRTYDDSQYGGNLNFRYSNRLFGLLYFGVGVVDTASKLGNDGMGLTGNVGASRKIGHWETDADFTYAQTVQTLYSIINTSNYSYGGSIRRRFNADTSWGAAARFSQAGFTTRDGNDNTSQSYSSFFGWRRYNFSGTYSKSNGTAVLSNTGELTPTPVGSLISNDFLLFDAESWSVGVGTRLFRSVTLTGGYSNFQSSTSMFGTGRSDEGTRLSVRSEYRLRKFQLIGGFNRTEQTVSIIPGGPHVINYYYVSLSRWFSVF